MKNKRLMISFLLLSCLIASMASAGSFKVTPIRMFIEGGQKSALFTVTNEAEEKVTIQIGVKAWSQDENGKDIYQPSNDLIVFPKIFTITEKGGAQVVRVAFRGQTAPKSKTEIAYRFFFEELPIKNPGEASALAFSLNLSVPVFIKPIKEVNGVQLVKVDFSQGAALLRIKNSGTANLRVGKMRITGIGPTGAEVFMKEETGWYVLSGASRVFPIPIRYKECTEIKKITASVEVDKTVLTGETIVDSAQCLEDKKLEPPSEPDAGPKGELKTTPPFRHPSTGGELKEK